MPSGKVDRVAVSYEEKYSVVADYLGSDPEDFVDDIGESVRKELEASS